MRVACPHCSRDLEVPDALAGQIARCGACSTLFTVPGAGAGAGSGAPAPAGPRRAASAETFGDVPAVGGRPAQRNSAPEGFPPPIHSSPYPPPPSYPMVPGGVTSPPPGAPVDGARLYTRVGVTGGLMLTLGVLSLLWAGLMLVYLVMLEAGMLDDMTDPDTSAGRPVFIVLAILSAGSGMVQLTASIQLIRKRLAARTLGITAAILGLCSLWTCCVWPFAIGLGIYALMVLVPNKPA